MSLLHTLISPFLKLAFNFRSKRRLPKIEGTLDVYGLRDTVTISRDQWGVPHITASNNHDLFLAQGFVHAQDRLWQMELNRRIATGTLSEIFGEVTVETDKLARTLGFKQLGEQDWDLQSEDAQQAIMAYTKGVNAYINHLDTTIPLEFSLIKFKPENWTKEDSMAISRMMIWQLSHAWYGETIRAQLIDAVGEEHAADLDIQYREGNPVQLPEGIEFNKMVDGDLKSATGPFLNNNMGSNGWVISAERSATGSPILANDMHLSLTLPSIWYHNHLRSKSLNVSGVSAPGMPIVLVGHNNDIAWGATLSYNDCEDLFIEQFNPDSDEQQYKYRDTWKDAEVRRELIEIKDEPNQQHIVTITEHGPIISEFLETKESLALQSKSLQPIQSLTGWYELNHASGWDEFVASIKKIEAPSLNLVYADAINIGYYNTGRVPIRAKGDGRVPVPGWTGEYEWTDEIPFEEMPHALNPEQGYLVTCNNKVISDDYDYELGGNFMNGFRAKRIEEYFDSETQLGMNQCKQMQLDYTTTSAPLFLAHYDNIEITDPNPEVSKAYQMMKDWDHVLSRDTVGGTLYVITRHMASRILLEKHLGETLTNRYLGNGLNEVILPTHEFYGQDIVVLLRLLDEDDNWWINHAGGKEQLLISAFKRAFEWLMDNYGTDHTSWTWGSIHQVTFPHAFSVQEPLDRVFNRGPYPVGGDCDTPNQMATMPESHDVTAWAPSWRQIVDLGDLTRSQWMYAPGQSGQLASEHYDDLIDAWLEGRYATMFWTRGQIENHQEGLLTLKSII